MVAQIVDLIGKIDWDANPDRRVNALKLGASGAHVNGSVGMLKRPLQRRKMPVPVGQTLVNGNGSYKRQSDGEQRVQQQNGLRAVRVGKAVSENGKPRHVLRGATKPSA